MNIYLKSIIIGVVITVALLFIPITNIPSNPVGEYPSAEYYGFEEYGFPFRTYWKYDYATYESLLTEEMAKPRGGDIYWWAIIVNLLLYTLIAFVILCLTHRIKQRS